MTEIELKFLLDRPDSEIWKNVRLQGVGEGRRSILQLKSTYFDTSDQDLRRAGIALRVRRERGRWLQTVKTGVGSGRGLSQVGEFECPAPAGRVTINSIGDPAVREAVETCIGDKPLQAVCGTDIKRHRQAVRLGETRAELAVDIGAILAGERSAQLREVEIELLQGRVGDLFDLALAVLPPGLPRFSTLSKFERGLLLAHEGFADPPLRPRKAGKIDLKASDPGNVSAEEILRECLLQVALNCAAVLELDDPEGPHQLRIGLRRMRTAFSVFRPVIDCAELKGLSDEARWLGGEVGALRNLDVIHDEIARREADRYPTEMGLQQLAEKLHEVSADQRAALRAILAGDRTRSFLIHTARFVEAGAWSRPDVHAPPQPTGELAAEALRKRWKKVRKSGRGIEKLTEEQRHTLRKELKKLRYDAEFFANLYPRKRIEAFLKQLKRLQAIFGDLNDAAVCKVLIDDLWPQGQGDAAMQRAAGWTIGATQARADLSWLTAKALWRKTMKTPVFWN